MSSNKLANNGYEPLSAFDGKQTKPLRPPKPANLTKINFDIVSRIVITLCDLAYPVVQVWYKFPDDGPGYPYEFSCTKKQDYGLSWLTVKLSELEWPCLVFEGKPGLAQITFVGPGHHSWNERKESFRDKITLLSSELIAHFRECGDHQTAQDLYTTHQQIMVMGNRVSTADLRQTIADLEALKVEAIE